MKTSEMPSSNTADEHQTTRLRHGALIDRLREHYQQQEDEGNHRTPHR